MYMVPFQTVFPDPNTHAEGEKIPQGEPSDIEFDEERPKMLLKLVLLASLERLSIKVKAFDLVLKTSTKHSSSSASASMPRKRTSNSVKFLLSYGTKITYNSFPLGVDPVQHLFLHQPENGIFYMDESQRMFF